MRIPINLLSTQLRKEWIELPACRFDRSLGVARIKLQEIPGDRFDDLWAQIEATQEAESTLAKATPRDAKAYAAAVDAERAAYHALIIACVCDHDAAMFQAQCPQEPITSAFGIECFAMLTHAGFSPDEAGEALETGIANKMFRADNLPDMARFYERCQPDREFLFILLHAIARFQRCDHVTPERIWDGYGAPVLKPVEVPPLALAKESAT